MEPQTSSKNVGNTDDDEKLNEVITAFLRRVIGLAQTKLNPQLQARIGPDDIAQSVFRTFARRFKIGQFPDVVNDSRGLWNLLAHLTVTRCNKAWQFHTQQKRNPSRETSSTATPDSEEIESEPMVDREPRPEDVAILRETLELCYAENGVNQQSRSVIESWLQGASFDAIAELDGVDLPKASIRKLCLGFFDAVLAKVKQEER
jgi:RNA polymerase sigma-70 factor, ECF subfamily